MDVPHKSLRQLLDKIVNFDPVIGHTARPKTKKNAIELINKDNIDLGVTKNFLPVKLSVLATSVLKKFGPFHWGKYLTRSEFFKINTAFLGRK